MAEGFAFAGIQHKVCLFDSVVAESRYEILKFPVDWTQDNTFKSIKGIPEK